MYCGVNKMNKKIKDFLEKIKIEWTQLRYGYSSSAKEFSDKLAEKGIILPIKLFHSYKLPDDISPVEYEKIVQEINLYTIFSKGILYDENLIKYSDIRLNNDEKEIIEKHVILEQPRYEDLLKAEVIKIKQLNPELMYINTDDGIYDKLQFLEGVNYGFAPEDIEYFLKRLMTDELINQDKLNNAELDKHLGFSPGYILSPENMDIVLATAKQYS